jgi:flagellar protein FlaJ
MKGFRYVFESISMVIGAVILLFSNLIVAGTMPFLVPVLNVVGGIVFVVPPTLIFYSRYRTTREMEQKFIGFIADLTDSINSGMTLPMALEHCSKSDYASLTPLVRDLNAQVSWGIPFEKALRSFGKRTGSRLIRRSVTTIIETYKIGGKISDTLDAVSKSVMTIEKLNRERRSSVYSQMVMLYLIFFVFIGILIIMQISVIPSLSSEGIGGMSLISEAASVPVEIYTETFVWFILIQGFFAGLAIGKMAEGSVQAGLKHSMILIIVGYALFSFAVQFQISFF